MPPEPLHKRAVAFVDGQNLFFAVREAFGFTYPNYDFPALARTVCEANSWQLTETRFYTGIPDPTDNAAWNHFWAGKLLQMSRQGVYTFSRSLRYRNKTVKLPDGSIHAFLTAEEKGIDVRIAIDVIRLAHRAEYDVAVLFTRIRTSPSCAVRFASSPRSKTVGSRLLAPSPSVRRRRTGEVWRILTGSRSIVRCTRSVSIRATIGQSGPILPDSGSCD